MAYERTKYINQTIFDKRITTMNVPELDQRFLARLELMRFIEEQKTADNPDGTFTVKASEEQTCTLWPVKDLKEKGDIEIKKYEEVLSALAMSNKDNWTLDQEQYKKTFANAVFRNLFKKNTWVRRRNTDARYLSSAFERKHVLKLGFMLNWDWKQVCHFTERVFSDELQKTKSIEEVVAAYCFSKKKTEEDYIRLCNQIIKDQVVSGGETLVESTAEIFQNAENCGNDDELIELARFIKPLLNSYSRSAHRIYTNLLLYSYLLFESSKLEPPSSTPFAQNGTSTETATERFAYDLVVSAEIDKTELWDRCIGELEIFGEGFIAIYDDYRGNLPEYDRIDWTVVKKEFESELLDKEGILATELFYYPAQNDNGEWVQQRTTSAIPEIMAGKRKPTKNDVLTLFWFIFTTTFDLDAHKLAPEKRKNATRFLDTIIRKICTACGFSTHISHPLQAAMLKTVYGEEDINRDDFSDGFLDLIGYGKASPPDDEQ